MSITNSGFVSSEPLSCQERSAFFYEGPINETAIDKTLYALDTLREMLGISRLQGSSIGYVINELCLNIVRYAMPEEQDPGNAHERDHHGRVMFGQDQEGMFVSTAFRLPADKQEDLRKKYQRIRTIKNEELEREYTEIWFSSRRKPDNVGMGLLSIARNAVIDANGERRIQLQRSAGDLMETTLYIQ